jgi:hypothetical protein
MPTIAYNAYLHRISYRGLSFPPSPFALLYCFVLLYTKLSFLAISLLPHSWMDMVAQYFLCLVVPFSKWKLVSRHKSLSPIIKLQPTSTSNSSLAWPGLFHLPIIHPPKQYSQRPSFTSLLLVSYIDSICPNLLKARLLFVRVPFYPERASHLLKTTLLFTGWLERD